MLKMLQTAPSDLGKQPEIRKDALVLDRVTGDIGDLRTYRSTDGKTKYLRVWAGNGVAGSPLWYEITPSSSNPTPSKEKTLTSQETTCE
ncbi:MAG: hypothetical protein ACRDQZ_13220 [Mycobacteriales bacterium]